MACICYVTLPARVTCLIFTTTTQGCIKLPNLELIPRQGLIYLPQNVAVFEHEYGKNELTNG